MKVKVQREKFGLKLNIQETKIMPKCPREGRRVPHSAGRSTASKATPVLPGVAVVSALLAGP